MPKGQAPKDQSYGTQRTFKAKKDNEVLDGVKKGDTIGTSRTFKTDGSEDFGYKNYSTKTTKVKAGASNPPHNFKKY